MSSERKANDISFKVKLEEYSVFYYKPKYSHISEDAIGVQRQLGEMTYPDFLRIRPKRYSECLNENHKYLYLLGFVNNHRSEFGFGDSYIEDLDLVAREVDSANEIHKLAQEIRKELGIK